MSTYLKVGFTGTRNGMTVEQARAFADFCRAFKPDEFHHGDCVGADAEAHDIVREVCPDCKIVVHPPVKNEHRANKACDETREPLSHFARTRAIVDETEILVGVSWASSRQTSGGTWYTLDYAKKKRKKRTVIWPDGSVSARGDDADF